MPAQPRIVDDRLRTAYADLAATVRPEDLPREAPAPSSQARRLGPVQRAARGQSRWAIPVAAGAAVLLVAAAAAVIPRALGAGSQSPTSPAWPRGIAYVISYISEKPYGFYRSTIPVVIPVNLATGKALKPIRLGVRGWTEGAAVSPGGRTIYVLIGGAKTGGQVVPFDVTTGRAERPIWVGGTPTYMLITPNGRTGYIVRPPLGVTVLNLAARSHSILLPMPEAGNIALTPNGRTVYVASQNGDTVTPIRTADDKAGRPIRTTEDASCSWQCASIAVTPDGTTVYVAGAQATGAAVITPISTATNHARRVIALRNRVVDPKEYSTSLTVSPDGKTAYVDTGTAIVPVNLVNGTARAALRFPPNAYAYFDGPALVSGDSKIVLVGGRGAWYRFAASSGHPLRTVSLGMNNGGGALGPDGRTLYTFGLLLGGRAERNPNFLLPVDVATGQIGRRIVLPDSPTVIVFGR